MNDNNNNKPWTSLFRSKRDYEKEQLAGVLKSESGPFYLGQEGIALRFEPTEDNPFMEEKTEKDANYTYGRQFKDFYIGTLRLPKEWKDGVSIGKYGNLELNERWFEN